MSGPALIDADKLTAARNLFAVFLEQNAGASIEVVRRPSGGKLGIKNPWGEDGLVIFLPDDPANLAGILNNLILPKQFTAIWHRDTKFLEVIWTAFPLSETTAELDGRKFKFAFDGVEYDCDFSASSESLLAIAEHTTPVGLSETNHRNLHSYYLYMRWRKDVQEHPEDEQPWPGKPLSFWVRGGGEWDNGVALSLAKHLNFYLTYFDHRSPHLLIWPPKTEPAKPRTRYLRDSFPVRIDARDLGEDILQFWSACRSGDTARRFVYYYRIIEHSSYTYVERDVRTKARRILSAPDAFSDIRRLSDKVIEVALSSEMDDNARIAALLMDAVDPQLLWREILLNRKSFEDATTFDGGYVLKPLITKDDTLVTFSNGGLAKFAGLARNIRNHLSHGRDRTTLTSITPTIDNFARLEPWVGAISIVAGEVITHRDAI